MRPPSIEIAAIIKTATSATATSAVMMPERRARWTDFFIALFLSQGAKSLLNEHHGRAGQRCGRQKAFRQPIVSNDHGRGVVRVAVGQVAMQGCRIAARGE